MNRDWNEMKAQAMQSHLGKSNIPGRENSSYKDPEMGMSLMFSGNSKKTSEGRQVCTREGPGARWCRRSGQSLLAIFISTVFNIDIIPNKQKAFGCS